jgi:hypothetical protein
VGIAGNVQANERDKFKLANGGKFELHPDVKPRKSIFYLLATNQAYNPGFINRPGSLHLFLHIFDISNHLTIFSIYFDNKIPNKFSILLFVRKILTTYITNNVTNFDNKLRNTNSENLNGYNDPLGNKKTYLKFRKYLKRKSRKLPTSFNIHTNQEISGSTVIANRWPAKN